MGNGGSFPGEPRSRKRGSLQPLPKRLHGAVLSKAQGQLHLKLLKAQCWVAVSNFQNLQNLTTACVYVYLTQLED
jgi:hypothetical protein